MQKNAVHREKRFTGKTLVSVREQLNSPPRTHPCPQTKESQRLGRTGQNRPGVLFLLNRWPLLKPQCVTNVQMKALFVSEQVGSCLQPMFLLL